MNHLTHDQIIDAVIGESSRATAEHLAVCSECRAELEGMKDSLAGFGESARNWSQASLTLQPTLDLGQPTYPQKTLRWSLAAAAIAIVTAIPVYRNAVERQRQQAADDARLLEQVDMQLSRSVPTPIEPLVDLLPEGEPR